MGTKTAFSKKAICNMLWHKTPLNRQAMAPPAVSTWSQAWPLSWKGKLLRGTPRWSRCCPAAPSPRLTATCTDPSPACCIDSPGTRGNNDPRSFRKEQLIFRQILPNRVKGLSASDTWMQFIKNPNKGRSRNPDVFCNARPRTNRVTKEHRDIRGCAKAP